MYDINLVSSTKKLVVQNIFILSDQCVNITSFNILTSHIQEFTNEYSQQM